MRRTVFTVLTVLVGTASAQMTWTLATPAAPWTPRLACAAVESRDTLWLMGGGRIDSDTWAFYNDIWKSVDGTNWSQAPPAPWYPKMGHVAVVFHEEMWVAGGEFTHPPYGYRDVWHSADGAVWTCAVESAPWHERMNHTLAVFRDTMWLVGGAWWNGSAYTFLNDVWRSGDGANWEQVTGAAPWSPRYLHSSAVFRDTLWLMGGGNYAGVFSDVWKTGDGDSWIEAASSAPWGSKSGHVSAVFEEKMWMMGGGWYNVPTNEVWYTADGDSWCQESAAGWSPRSFSSVVVRDSMLWVMAGDTTTGRNTGSNDAWYTTGPSDIKDRPGDEAPTPNAIPNVVRGILRWEADGRHRAADRAELLDAAGRKVMDLVPGPNDIHRVAPGVHFLRTTSIGTRSAVSKVIVAR